MDLTVDALMDQGPEVDVVCVEAEDLEIVVAGAVQAVLEDSAETIMTISAVDLVVGAEEVAAAVVLEEVLMKALAEGEEMDPPRGALVGHVVAEDSGEDMKMARREVVMMGDMGVAVAVAMEEVIMVMVVALVMIVMAALDKAVKEDMVAVIRVAMVVARVVTAADKAAMAMMEAMEATMEVIKAAMEEAELVALVAVHKAEPLKLPRLPSQMMLLAP